MCTQLLLLGFPYQHAGIEFDFLLCVCHKEVAEANFALHETHCSRFLCLCPECDEAVPRDQLAEHKEEPIQSVWRVELSADQKFKTIAKKKKVETPLKTEAAASKKSSVSNE
uniref:XIAP associated factor 1 n=1 Tax=Acanthochromis polyacanthus TaxID=80966 RepID=A0A3Q1F042_9TELE